MNFLKPLALLTQVGLNMIVPIFLCVLAGKWLDERLGTAPILLIVFIIIGVLAAFRNLFVLIKKVSDE